MGKNAVLELSLHLNVPGKDFFQSRRCIGEVFIISETLRFKSQSPGHHMPKYGQKYSGGATTPFRYTRQN